MLFTRRWAEVVYSRLVDAEAFVVQGVVVDVRRFGCFIAFDVEAESGHKHKVYGMVHVSEVSWDYCDDARLRVRVNSCGVSLSVFICTCTVLLNF